MEARAPARERTARALAVAGALLAAGGLAYVLMAPRAAEGFTEFYVLDADSRAGRDLAVEPGAEVRLIVGVVNREGRDLDYRLDTRLAGADGDAATPLDAWAVRVRDGDKSEEPWTTTSPLQPGSYRLTLELRREGDDAPYRSLALRIRVEG